MEEVKKQNIYETVIIVSASLEDEDIEKILKRYEEFFKNNNVEILEIEKWGRKRMAYHIKKIRTGYYFLIRFKSEGNFIKKFERALQIDEQILRYLTVKLDKKALAYAEAQKGKPVASLEEEYDFEDVNLNQNLDEQDTSNNNQ
ncbi:MAG: 30S ribosomal protein S6 [Ignavibacteria bacterium]|nr:30S ribosomal protein S6 [Ignavibacteria bacterium]